MKIVPHTSKAINVVHLEGEETVTVGELVFFALGNGAFEDDSSSDMLQSLIWVCTDSKTELGYTLKHLRQCQSKGAVVNAKEWIHLQDERKAA